MLLKILHSYLLFLTLYARRLLSLRMSKPSLRGGVRINHFKKFGVRIIILVLRSFLCSILYIVLMSDSKYSSTDEVVDTLKSPRCSPHHLPRRSPRRFKSQSGNVYSLEVHSKRLFQERLLGSLKLLRKWSGPKGVRVNLILGALI